MAKVNRIEYKCQDGIIRTFDSLSEIRFMEFCEQAKIKIIRYNTDKSHKYQLFDKPELWIRSKKLEKVLWKSDIIYEIDKMRNMEASFKSWDFHIEIDGQEFLCEVKWKFTNKNEMSMNERQYYTAWAMVKSMMAAKYKLPFIVFVERPLWKHWLFFDVEYYIPETYSWWQ